MSEQKYISELHDDHNQWISQLDMAQTEMNSFRNRLEEIAKANTVQDVMAQVEHFQNQFIRESEVIDILKHDIQNHEKELAANASSNATAVDHRKVADHPELRDRMGTFLKLYSELKEEFTNFLSRAL